MQNLYVLVVFFLLASVAEGRSPTPPPNEFDLADVQSANENEEECPFCPVCPTCPQNILACHIPVYLNTPCLCFTCLTRCYARESVCAKGESCILEDVNYGNTTIGQTAVCKPFKECREEKCLSQCPVSGFFVDVNGCQTCLCNDPCQELKCKGGCRTFLTNPGMEPYYICDRA